MFFAYITKTFSSDLENNLPEDRKSNKGLRINCGEVAFRANMANSWNTASPTDNGSPNSPSANCSGGAADPRSIAKVEPLQPARALNSLSIVGWCCNTTELHNFIQDSVWLTFLTTYMLLIVVYFSLPVISHIKNVVFSRSEMLISFITLL